MHNSLLHNIQSSIRLIFQPIWIEISASYWQSYIFLQHVPSITIKTEFESSPFKNRYCDSFLCLRFFLSHCLKLFLPLIASNAWQHLCVPSCRPYCGNWRGRRILRALIGSKPQRRLMWRTSADRTLSFQLLSVCFHPLPPSLPWRADLRAARGISPLFSRPSVKASLLFTHEGFRMPLSLSLYQIASGKRKNPLTSSVCSCPWSKLP